MEGRAGAEKTYQHLTASYSDLLVGNPRNIYRITCKNGDLWSLPMRKFSRHTSGRVVSVLQGMVNNPYSGCGASRGIRTRARASVRDLRGFSAAIRFGLRSRLNAAGDFTSCAHRRSSLSASTSGKTARSTLNFGRRRVLCMFKDFPTHTRSGRHAAIHHRDE